MWPDETASRQLESLAERTHAVHPGARRVPRANLHLTLAFIGPLASESQAMVARSLASIDAPSFTWQVDRIGAFAHARVAWAASANCNRDLDALAGTVREALDLLGVAYDRRPFVPHVTLLRSVPRADIGTLAMDLDQPIPWTVRRPVLLKSVSTTTGVRYVQHRSVA